MFRFPGLSRPRWRTPEYALLDVSIFTGVAAMILYIATPMTAVSAGSTMIPSEVLTLIGIEYGSTQRVLGGLLVLTAIATLVMSLRPAWLDLGYRILWAANAFWCSVVLASVLLGSAAPRNLVVAMFFGACASHLAQNMPEADD